MGQVATAGIPSHAGAEIRIVKSNGALVATARTDTHGRYRASVPAGEYRVERGTGFSGTPRNLPALVAISPGGETQLDVWVEPPKGQARAPR